MSAGHTMKPTLLPALHSIHQAIAVEGQSLILFKNGTYLLIRENDTVDSLISAISGFDPNKFVDLNLHFYTTHDIKLFMQPDYPTIGYLSIIEKDAKISKTSAVGKLRAIQNMRKDMVDKSIVVDSRSQNLEDLAVTMYFVVNTSLKMGKGKIAGQVGHAVETLIEDLIQKPTQGYINWKYSLRRKVVLKATEDEIQSFLKDAGKQQKNNKTINNDSFIMVRDAGLTQIDPGSLTVLGFVPMEARNRPAILKNLKLL